MNIYTHNDIFLLQKRKIIINYAAFEKSKLLYKIFWEKKGKHFFVFLLLKGKSISIHIVI
jgi:hypothetical protein